MFKRIYLMGAALALAFGVIVASGQTMLARAQMGPMMGQTLDQLSGDEFDKAFLTQMAMHHAMAIPMSPFPVMANAAHQEVKDLGGSIITAQAAEIQMMGDWLKAWYGLELPPMVGMMAQGNNAPMGMAGPGGMMGGQNGMGGQGPMVGGPNGMPGDAGLPEMSMMADLWKLPPNRLEAVFLSQMIPHHQGAIDMAQLVPSRAAHQEIKDLAQQIISSQSAEIAQMNAWLAAWYGL